MTNVCFNDKRQDKIKNFVLFWGVQQGCKLWWVSYAVVSYFGRVNKF